MNLPANVHEQVAYWIESNDLLSETFMQESGVEVVKWFVCSGEYDSLQAFANSLKAFSGRLSHIFVRNLGLHTNWSDVEKSPLYREAKKQYEFREIEFPGLRKAEQMHVQQSRVPMSLLREDESLSILSKQRLTKFLRQTAIAIQKSGAIATPQPPETDG